MRGRWRHPAHAAPRRHCGHSLDHRGGVSADQHFKGRAGSRLDGSGATLGPRSAPESLERRMNVSPRRCSQRRSRNAVSTSSSARSAGLAGSRSVSRASRSRSVMDRGSSFVRRRWPIPTPPQREECVASSPPPACASSFPGFSNGPAMRSSRAAFPWRTLRWYPTDKRGRFLVPSGNCCWSRL